MREPYETVLKPDSVSADEGATVRGTERCVDPPIEAVDLAIDMAGDVAREVGRGLSCGCTEGLCGSSYHQCATRRGKHDSAHAGLFHRAMFAAPCQPRCR